MLYKKMYNKNTNHTSYCSHCNKPSLIILEEQHGTLREGEKKLHLILFFITLMQMTTRLNWAHLYGKVTDGARSLVRNNNVACGSLIYNQKEEDLRITGGTGRAGGDGFGQCS